MQTPVRHLYVPIPDQWQRSHQRPRLPYLRAAFAFQVLDRRNLARERARRMPPWRPSPQARRTTNRYYVDADHQCDEALMFFPDVVRFFKGGTSLLQHGWRLRWILRPIYGDLDFQFENHGPKAKTLRIRGGHEQQSLCIPAAIQVLLNDDPQVRFGFQNRTHQQCSIARTHSASPRKSTFNNNRTGGRPAIPCTHK